MSSVNIPEEGSFTALNLLTSAPVGRGQSLFRTYQLDTAVRLGLTQMNWKSSIMAASWWRDMELQLDYSSCEGVHFPMIVSLGLVQIPEPISVPRLWLLSPAAMLDLIKVLSSLYH